MATANGAGTAEPAVKSAKKGKKTKRGRRKGVTAATVEAVPAAKLTITFDEFVQDYWKKV